MRAAGFLCATLGLALAGPALAENEEALANLEQARLVQVRPGPSRYFYSAYETGCPAPKPKCRQKAYVVAGDLLVAYETVGAYTNVDYVSVKGRSFGGWIESGGLIAAQVPTSSWLGTWQGTEQSIVITPTRKSGQFRAHGTATWGAEDPDRVERGGVHTGSVDASFTPASGRATLTEGSGEYGCVVKLRLLGPYLATADNLNCGGLNVSFSGALRRAGR